MLLGIPTYAEIHERLATFANSDCLDEIRKRLVTFANNEHSIEAAADVGLFAFAVFPEYGGLYWGASGNDLFRVMNSFYPPITWVQLQWLWQHNSVCHAIQSIGTSVQYDIYLPQLAAGKRIGVATSLRGDTRLHASLRATACENGFRLSGVTVARSWLTPRSFVMVTAWLNKTLRKFVIDDTCLPPTRRVSQKKVFLDFQEWFVPELALLGGLVPDTELTNEKWEAIRWRTDQSVS